MRLKHCLLMTLLCCQPILADETASAPSSPLEVIDRHLAALAPLIVAAEDSHDPDARIAFRYDWLQRDIALIRRGLRAHIERAPSACSDARRLYGDYGR